MQDTDMALKKWFKGNKQSFAWHVRNAIEAAGIHVDDPQPLLNVFPGIEFHPLFEPQQRSKQHSFSLIAMDRATRALVTHTLLEKINDYTIEALGERDVLESGRYAEHYKSFEMKARMTRAVHS
jgi:kynurenine formamidase